MAGRSVSGRVGPASWLVPFIVAGGCRVPWPGAVQGCADAWLRDGRAGPQDVQVARQRHGAAGGERQIWRRHPAPVGDVIRHVRGSAHRPGDPEAAIRTVSPSAQHAALGAGQS